MVELGKIYKTHGGWDAKVIWVSEYNMACCVIHKPNTPNESFPVAHDKNTGVAVNSFTVGAIPTYGVSQPADLVIPKT